MQISLSLFGVLVLTEDNRIQQAFLSQLQLVLYVSVQEIVLRYLVLPADKCKAPYLSHSVLSAFSVFDP